MNRLLCPRCYRCVRLLVFFDPQTDPTPGALEVCPRCIGFIRTPEIDLKAADKDVVAEMADWGDWKGQPAEERARLTLLRAGHRRAHRL